MTEQDKAAELRAATREANEVLGDLRREKRDIKKLIKTAFDEYVAEFVKHAEHVVGANVVKLANELRDHADRSEKALMNRWKYIETKCLASPEIARLIALHVLQGVGGPVETKNAKWHLVKEIPEEDGTSVFAFHKSLTTEADADPKVAAAIQKAVEVYRPDLQSYPWSTLDLEGLKEQ